MKQLARSLPEYRPNMHALDAGPAKCRVVIAASRTTRGDGRQAAALVTGLVGAGHEVILLVPGPRQPDCDRLGNPSVLVWPSKRPTSWRDARFLLRVVRQFKPTHVIANFGAVNLMMVIGWLCRVPHRISWYRTLSSQIAPSESVGKWSSVARRIRKRAVYALATHVVANSATSRRDALAVYRLSPSKVRTFPNFVADPEQRAKLLSQEPPEERIVCLGRLHITKGQDLLLRAIAILQDEFPNLHVEFIGGGPAKEQYLELASDLGIAGRCSFMGGLPHGEALRRLAEASVSVVPSRAEAFGLVNIESLGVGTPVIGSDVGGIGEIVRHGVDGLLFPPGDVTALADALRAVLTNPTLRSNLARNARTRFSECYEESVVVTQLIRWLEQMNEASH